MMQTGSPARQRPLVPFRRLGGSFSRLARCADGLAGACRCLDEQPSGATSKASALQTPLNPKTIPLTVAAWFVAGGGVGLFAGRALGQRLSGPRLQKIFACALLAVAAFILARTAV